METKTGADWRVRPVQVADAESFLALTRQLRLETSNLLLEPDEGPVDVASQRDLLLRRGPSDTEYLAVAEVGHHLIGYVGARRGQFRREAHRAGFVVAVLREWWGRGVADALLRSMEEWARSCNIRRLEMTVRADNVKAICRYTRLGFEVEGLRRDALVIDGASVAELYMSKLVEER